MHFSGIHSSFLQWYLDDWCVFRVRFCVILAALFHCNMSSIMHCCFESGSSLTAIMLSHIVIVTV
jgi:hypothetical protein